MRKMKKFIAMLLVLAMTLAVCGVAAYAEGEKTTVTMIAAQYGPKTGDWWADFEAKFEQSHPEIDLVVDVVSWNDIYTVVNTRLSNRNAPDLLNIDVFADYQADGLLLPAEQWCSPETYAKMYPAFLEQSVVDGVVWAVPDLASARAMYYNKDILDKAGVAVPTTWDELTAACETIKEKCPDVYPWGQHTVGPYPHIVIYPYLPGAHPLLVDTQVRVVKVMIKCRHSYSLRQVDMTAYSHRAYHRTVESDACKVAYHHITHGIVDARK